MTRLFAQPYDISALGFYFSDGEEYQKKASKLRNSAGEPVEEFEIQFIDGESIDAELFKAVGINQMNLLALLDAVGNWDEWQKIKVIIAVGEVGYSFDPNTDNPDDFDIDIYELDTLQELAKQFIDEGLFGEIPESLQFYINYEVIARDLAMDYSETCIAGKNLIYRCD